MTPEFEQKEIGEASAKRSITDSQLARPVQPHSSGGIFSPDSSIPLFIKNENEDDMKFIFKLLPLSDEKPQHSLDSKTFTSWLSSKLTDLSKIQNIKSNFEAEMKERSIGCDEKAISKLSEITKTSEGFEMEVERLRKISAIASLDGYSLAQAIVPTDNCEDSYIIYLIRSDRYDDDFDEFIDELNEKCGDHNILVMTDYQ